MKIIIAGIGKIGETLCGMLANEGHDVIVIDTNSKIVDKVVNSYDVFGLVGNGATASLLIEAEADKSDIFIACTESDELNIMSCVAAQKLGAKNTLARVRNPEYYSELNFIYSQLGLSLIINPEYETASEIERIIRFPSATKIETFAKGRVALAEISITNGHRLADKALSELKNIYSQNMLVCAVERGGEVYIPSGDFVIKANDTVYFTAPHQSMGKVFKELGLLKRRIKSVMIIGGGRICYYLAKKLLKLKISVTIIELNETVCGQLAALLPEATVINADGTNSDILIEEGIDSVDACVSLTDIDEENIIVSMFARSRKVEKIITKVTRNSLIDMLPSAGIDVSIVSPRFITANSIMSYARARSNATSGTVKTAYSLVNNTVEAIEFEVGNGFKCLDTPLKLMNIKSNILIACLLRDNVVIHPNGDTVIKSGDRVIIVTTSGQLTDINDILQR